MLRPDDLVHTRRCRRFHGVAVLSAVAAALGGLGFPVHSQPIQGGAGYDVAPAAPAEQRRGLQSWVTDTSITTRATLTNNANYGVSQDSQGDLILEVIPQIRFNRQGSRLLVDGSVALDLLAYVNGTQVNRILPTANIRANLEAIDNLFFIDSSLVVSQQVENIFLPSSQWSSANNLYTATQVSLAPYLKGNLGPNVTWRVRSDNTYTWTTQTNAPLSDTYFARNLAEIVRAPTPFGLTLRLTNDITRVQNQVQPDQTLYTALAIFDYAVTPQLLVGLRGGYENTNYTLQETSGPIYGANATWRPTPLTSVDGFWEERFYGPSYQYQFSHRQRRVASSFSGYRTVSTYPQTLLTIPATGNVSGLLNAVLTARFPDPVERAQQVQDLILRQGLPSSLPAGTTVYNYSANVLTGFNAGWALTGVRNTLGFNLFYLKTESLPDARIPPTFLAFNNNIQEGAGVSLSHQLTPVVALNGTVTTTYTRGVGQNEGLSTHQRAANLQSNWQASPRTTVFVGVRYQVQNDTSRALARTESNEAAVFAGLNHRL